MKLVCLLLLLFSIPAYAQTNHEKHHANYQSWVNQNDKGCCDNNDCGEIADPDERTIGGILEVHIEGLWCPVKPWMYLKRGNAADWNTSHACVIKPTIYNLMATACERFICYQPKPQF